MLPLPSPSSASVPMTESSLVRVYRAPKNPPKTEGSMSVPRDVHVKTPTRTTAHTWPLSLLQERRECLRGGTRNSGSHSRRKAKVPLHSGLPSPLRDPCRILHQAGGATCLQRTCRANGALISDSPDVVQVTQVAAIGVCLSSTRPKSQMDERRVSKFSTSKFLHGSWRLCSRELGARSTRTLAWPDAARARCCESWTNLTCGHGFGAFSGCADYPGLAAAVVTEPPALTRHVSGASSNTRAWSGKHSVFVLLRRIIEVFGHWFVDCVHSFSSRDLSSLRFPIFCPLI